MLSIKEIQDLENIIYEGLETLIAQTQWERDNDTDTIDRGWVALCGLHTVIEGELFEEDLSNDS